MFRKEVFVLHVDLFAEWLFEEGRAVKIEYYTSAEEGFQCLDEKGKDIIKKLLY